MKLKTMMIIAAGFALTGVTFASDTRDTGEAMLLFKESGSFWHTATNSTITVPIDFKDGATSAALTVRGSTYLRVYEGITERMFTFSFPAADDVAHEDVYELSLLFDNGLEMKTRIGLPYGLMAGAEGATRCISENSARWLNTYAAGLMPIPAGATALSVEGSPVTDVTAGYTGAQGWLAIGPVEVGTPVMVSMTENELACTRTLVGSLIGGFTVLIR